MILAAEPMCASSNSVMPAGDRLLRLLWLALAVTFPLFAVEFLRFNSETLRIHVAPPMIVLALILVLGCAMLVTGAVRGVDTGWRPVPKTRPERTLLMALGCFVGWHIVGWARAAEWVLPTRELAKVAFGAFSIWGIMTFFPRKRGFLERFWTIVLWASALLVAVLIVEYAFVFHYPYLGNQIGGVPNSYSIQLAWYLTPILLFGAFYFAEARGKVIAFLGLFIFVTGLLYISSRSAWVAAAAGLLTSSRRVGRRLFVWCVGGIAATIVAGGLFLWSAMTLEPAFLRRALFLISPGSVPELHTYEIRYDLTRATWGCLRASPLIGIGLGATDRCIDFATHNDYMKILSDLGVIGLALFVGVLAIVGITVLSGGQRNADARVWISCGSQASLVALAIVPLFHNLYTAVFFWLLLGLLCAEARLRRDTLQTVSRPTV